MSGSRPRLLLVGLVPPEAGGCISCGVASHVFELGQQAAARGYETSILAPLRSNRVSGAESIRLLNASRPRTSRLLSGGWAAIRRGGQVPVLPALNWRNRISVLSWTERIREAMEETRAEIVHIHPLLHPGGPGLGDLPQGIPFIFTDHGFWQDLRDDDDMKKIRETARLATAVVAVSRHCLDQQDRLGLVFGGSREVIPNAITPAPDESGRGKGSEGRPRVLFVAGVESITRKGLDILIRAFAECPELKAGAELAVITEAESAPWAAAAMAAEGIAGAVHPLCSRQELAAVYRAADVLALPSRSEAFGLVFLEALAVGTPVVGFAPTILELRDRLGEGVGLPFDAGLETPADLAAKLLAVLRRPKERDGLATRTKAAFSWDVIFPALDRLYLRLWRRERV